MDSLNGESKTILPVADVLVVKEHYILISPKNTFDFYSLSLGSDPPSSNREARGKPDPGAELE